MNNQLNESEQENNIRKKLKPILWEQQFTAENGSLKK